MQNTIFSSASESFLVAHVIHAGAVTELPEEKQKNGYSHYFRITTVRGSAFCRFKTEEAARKSRGLLGAMLGTVKPHLFRCKGDSMDLASIVSFGRIVELKHSTTESEQFGLPIRMNAADEKSCTIWLTFKTEESGQNVRKALWAALMSYYAPEREYEQPQEHQTMEVAEAESIETNIVFSEV